MPKFLLKGSYTAEGAKGVAKEGGSGRKKAVEALVKSAGGSVESFYYALGQEDVVFIADLPDNVAATAMSVAVATGGGARLTIVPLLTVEEMDAAAKKSVTYRAPGK